MKSTRDTRDILENTKGRRAAPVLWGSGALAATILVLGVNGTLSTWTTAIIDNNNNSVASTAAVALVETQVTPTGNTTVCDTATSATNTLQGSASCSGINKFGGIGTAGHATGDTTANDATNAFGAALNPDGSNTQTVVVNLKNDGTASGALTLNAGTCQHYAYPGSTGTDTTTYDLCTKMQIAVSCTDPAGGSTAVFAPAADTVTAFTGTGKAIATLAATKSTDCTFTVTLPADTPSGYASQYLTQDLKWTLTKS